MHMVKKKLFSNSLSLPLLIIALSVAYYFVIFLPKKDNERRAAEEARSKAVAECYKVISDDTLSKASKLTDENVSTTYNLLMKACLNKRGFKE